MKSSVWAALAALALGGVLGWLVAGRVPAAMPEGDESLAGEEVVDPDVRVTEDALASSAAASGPDEVGVVLPAGDPERGREAFVRHHCSACHVVPSDPDLRAPVFDTGPDLGAELETWPPGRIASAITAPDHRITQQAGEWTDRAGTSLMPSYIDVLTIQELSDLISWLASPSVGVPDLPR